MPLKDGRNTLSARGRLVIVFLLGLGLGVGATYLYLSGGGGSPGEKSPARPQPELEVGGLALGSSQAGPGENVIVSAVVINDNDSRISQKIELRVDGEVENSRTVELKPGKYTVVSFKVERKDPGPYRISVGGKSHELNISAGEELEYERFVSKSPNFSIPYPGEWVLNYRLAPEGVQLFVAENRSKGSPEAFVKVFAGDLGLSGLDNIENQVETRAENSENIVLTNGPEHVTVGGVSGIDFSFRNLGSDGGRGRDLFLKGENREFHMEARISEVSYENFEAKIGRMVENFTVLKDGGF